MSKFIALILVLAFFATITFSLKCYKCDPDSSGKCKTLDNDDEFPCENQIKPSPQVDDWSCYSIYFESKSNNRRSGIYRGCRTKRKDSSNVCDTLKIEERKGEGGTVVSCKECKEDLCNVGSPDGAASLTLSITTFFIAVVCFYFSNF
ncbi:uncharacterized protein LOC123003824 [Tribolium madens]|uniref:uncharacterized protein LOC123003824 n=1 Tax=Tribolium madens TaxID=41895 RepID=UPI001CF7246F|nr:uncharacterized protein LOC123003824 [Tribolium madens]